MNKPLLKVAALNALGTVLYITLVSTLMFNAEHIFGNGKEDIVLIPIAMLLLFVLSASIISSLVLGRPILWYLEGKKNEAVSLFIATLGFLFLAMITAFSGLILLK